MFLSVPLLKVHNPVAYAYPYLLDLASRIQNLSSISASSQLNFAPCFVSAIISLYKSVLVRIHWFQIRKILYRSKLIYFLM